jgi:DNA-binding NtrC family response regulator
MRVGGAVCFRPPAAKLKHKGNPIQMARVMICDDDRLMAAKLVEALREAGHEAEACVHTMDVLRAASGGAYDLVAVGLDMAGFGRAGAVEALREIAPRTSLIALHDRPAEIMRAATAARVAAVLPRPVRIKDFMYAVACALSERVEATRPAA